MHDQLGEDTHVSHHDIFDAPRSTQLAYTATIQTIYQFPATRLYRRCGMEHIAQAGRK